MPSWLTGQGSALTGNDSALTATGVCAPLHPDFIKDGTSFLTGNESVLTATTPDPCDTPPPPEPPPGPPIGTRNGSLTIEFLIDVPDGGLGIVTICNCQDPEAEIGGANPGLLLRHPNYLFGHDDSIPDGNFGATAWGAANFQNVQYNNYKGGNLKFPAPPGAVIPAGLRHVTFRRTNVLSPFTSFVQVFVDGVLINGSPGEAMTNFGMLGFNPRLMLGGNYNDADPPLATRTSLDAPIATFRLVNYARSDADILADALYTLPGRVHPVIPTTVCHYPFQNTLADNGPNGLNMTITAGVAAYTPMVGALVAFDFDSHREMQTVQSTLLKCYI